MDLLKKLFFAGLTLLPSVNLLVVTPLRFISMTNQESKVTQKIVNVNSGESVFSIFDSICLNFPSYINNLLFDKHNNI